MNSRTDLHPALPPIPRNMQRLPVDPRGYPVPYFVQWFHADGKAASTTPNPEAGDYPDFRVTDSRKMAMAHKFKLCWVCGGQLGVHLAFVIGPMCAVNRTSGEPPAHRDCAIFSATACPFLSKPAVARRENNMPDDPTLHKHPGGLDRNPGVAMVWMTRSYRVHKDEDGVLFRFGDPDEVLFFAEGRPATRAEVMHSIDTGMPSLREVAALQEGGLEALEQMYQEALPLVPAA